MDSDFDAWHIKNNTSTASHPGETIDGGYVKEIYLSAVAFISILIVVSNSIVVIVVAFCENLHLPTLWNIAFMATCDLSYGLYYLIFIIPSLFIGEFAYSESIITPASIVLTLLFGQNIFNIFLSIVDRYIAVIWPLRYHYLMSAKRFLIAVLILVVINILRMCLIIFSNSSVYYNSFLGLCIMDFDTMMVAVAAVGLPLLTSIFITVLLVKIAIEFRCRQKVHPTAISSLSNKFTVTMCLAAVVFILCYIPSCWAIVLNAVYGKENVSKSIPQTVILVLLSNSFWNVVIYATTYRPFRNGFLKLFCKTTYRDQARREVMVAYCADTDSSAENGSSQCSYL